MTGIRIPKPSVDTPRQWVGKTHPETSHAMQRKAMSKQGTLRRAIYDLLTQCPRTDEEVAVILDRKDHHISATRRTLVLDGWVEPTGMYRKTISNNDATVWKAVK